MKFMSVINSFFNKENKEDKKIKPAVFLLVCGVVVILFSGFFSPSPSKKEEKNEPKIENIREKEEKRLERMLSQIDGVKDATVLISYKNSGVTEAMTEERTVLKKSQNQKETSNTETQLDKKPVFDGDKNIVAKTQYMPEIKGVCIFYSGISSKKTEDKLYRAIKGALGVELHKVEVIHTKQ